MADARAPVLDMHAIVCNHDVLFVVLDTLRFDVAQTCFEAGRLPMLTAEAEAGPVGFLCLRRQSQAAFEVVAMAVGTVTPVLETAVLL